MCWQVKGYRYLEEDNSDESDSERSEEDDGDDRDKNEDGEHVVEERRAEDRGEEGQDAGVQGADSPGTRRRGPEGHHRRLEDANVKEEEREEREEW